ncbi:hypothetical protein Afil01_01170 [Actinorhabdospora filicis]|uniref:SDR family NAD(P)-dependent oxidoreductase n=1 Tax=Actinorhabdospora filicis TaxID=1785913 RepID=A0A9W6SDL5_9ACTN|nr:hypothetical protein [Actinorhabdospora filicis]GLZ75310.1 hypothetical protein Afil01_01170 [Actinorhabdospora filicis]
MYRRARPCALCAAKFRHAHGHYRDLCPSCAAAHWTRRTARADLSGRLALVTGIADDASYELTRMLLRDGAEVAVVTDPRSERNRARLEQEARTAPDSRLTVLVNGLSGQYDVDVLGRDMYDRYRGRLSILVNTAHVAQAPYAMWRSQLEAAAARYVVPTLLVYKFHASLSKAPGGGHVITVAPGRIDALPAQRIHRHDIVPATPPRGILDDIDAAATLYAPLVAAFPRAT